MSGKKTGISPSKSSHNRHGGYAIASSNPSANNPPAARIVSAIRDPNIDFAVKTSAFELSVSDWLSAGSPNKLFTTPPPAQHKPSINRARTEWNGTCQKWILAIRISCGFIRVLTFQVSQTLLEQSSLNHAVNLLYYTNYLSKKYLHRDS